MAFSPALAKSHQIIFIAQHPNNHPSLHRSRFKRPCPLLATALQRPNTLPAHFKRKEKMEYFGIIISIAIVLFSADTLTEGASKIARKLSMSEMLIGLTIVAMGTSLPELCVSITSAVNGVADMAVGNVIGSNIFNIFMIVGLCAMVNPMSVAPTTVKRDLPFMFFASLALIAILFDSRVSRLEGALLLLAFIAFTSHTIIHAKKEEVKEGTQQEKNVDAEKKQSKMAKIFKNPILQILCGIGGLILGSNFFVAYATTVAHSLGISEAVIGIVILGFGTSLPELATSLVAATKGKTSIALGNVIGSCVFNILMIVGVTATILPLDTREITILDLVMLFAGAFLLWLFSFTKKTMERWEGGVLFLIFVGYLTFLLV